MIKRCISIACSFFLLLSAPAASTQQTPATLELKFYSEQLLLAFNSNMVLKENIILDEAGIRAFYQKMEKTAYKELLSSLESYRQRLRLNDWLYYELMRTAVLQIYNRKSSLQQTLSCWFLLSQSGFDTRLTYYEGRAFVYVYSEEGIYETPMIKDGERKYINLSSIHEKMEQPGVALNLLTFTARPDGRAFSFELKQLPLLNAEVKEKKLSFNYREATYTLKVKADQTLYKLMKNYPIFDEHKYFEVPLSPTLHTSLLPQLQELIKGRSLKAQLEILASFTRAAFDYKEDMEHFGHSKPMIADEVFHYAYSDCEDRSALFYSLVKALLDLPMIIIAYPDHLTVAVAGGEQIAGIPIAFQGRNYYICDPTGPKFSNDIGRAPKGYEGQNFEILGKYK